MFAGCASKNATKDENDIRISTYVEKLENYKPHEKNLNNTVDNKEFDEFLDTIFYDFIGEDFLSMHFSVVDYKSLNITKPEVNCGKVEYAFDEDTYTKSLRQLEDLKKFDYDSLSYRQQYDYDVVEYNAYETILSASCYKYHFLFTTSSNIIENIETNFLNYTFYDLESLDDYMTCLKDIDRFFDDCLTYTKKQADEGLYLLDGWLDEVEDYGYSLLGASEISFLTEFENRINDLDFISDDEKKEYIKENNEIVENEVLPAIEKTLKEIEKYRGKANYENSKMINYSKDYAKAQYYLQGSFNDSIDEVFNLLVDELKTLTNAFITCIEDSNLQMYLATLVYEPIEPFTLDAKGILEFLRKNAYKAYPDLGNVSYNIDYLSDETGSSNAKAYYFESPLDNYNQNIIKVNPNNCDGGVDTFTTLAHEGFPGHLFQHVYSLKANEHKFRRVLGFIGNSEGYAVSAQKDSLYIAGIDDQEVIDALFFYYSDYFIMYSILDIGVNYYGWKVKDIKNFFNSDDVLSQVYEFDDDGAQMYYDFFIEMPASYIPYGVGYAKHQKLRNKAKNALENDFDLPTYNNYVLKNGCIPFVLLEGCIDEYIKSN